MGGKSSNFFQKAVKFIPGGVNSPVRAGKSVGVDPLFIERARDCYIWDVDEKRYIDYVCSWGPMVLGHGHPDVVKAIGEQLLKGTSYGAPTWLEVEMAETIVNMVPSIEMVRMVNSGTEATMSAIRLARGYTGRDKIIKFEGCYHGHADSLLVAAGSGVATLGIPGSPGVPDVLAMNTISLSFNDLEGVTKAFDKYGDEVAAVIVEPIPANMGVIIPDIDFLRGLRKITLDNVSLLIFDEVISGFRVSPGGAQEYFDIMPDITCLGKIIGGGLPVGAYGGNRKIMERMAPEGDIYQAGTLSGNPLAMSAGLATLKVLNNPDIFKQLEIKGKRLFKGILEAADSMGQEVQINYIGSLGTLFFTRDKVNDFSSAKRCDTEKFKRFYRAMLEQGIYLAPSPFEALFVSLAHDEESIDKTIRCAEKAFQSI